MTLIEMQKILQSVMPDVEFVQDQDTGEIIIETGMVVDESGNLVSEIETAIADSLETLFANESFDVRVASHCNFDASCKDPDCLCDDDFDQGDSNWF